MPLTVGNAARAGLAAKAAEQEAREAAATPAVVGERRSQRTRQRQVGELGRAVAYAELANERRSANPRLVHYIVKF